MRFQTESGKETNQNDPQRLLWYSAGTGCGFWTDDWEQLSLAGSGIPCCPCCSSVGFQTTAEDWNSGIKSFANEAGHSGYANFVNAIKGECGGGVEWMDRFETWRRETHD